MQSADCILSPMQSADCAGSQIACNIHNIILLLLLSTCMTELLTLSRPRANNSTNQLTGSLHSCGERYLAEGSHNPGRGASTPWTVEYLHVYNNAPSRPNDVPPRRKNTSISFMTRRIAVHQRQGRVDCCIPNDRLRVCAYHYTVTVGLKIFSSF